MTELEAMTDDEARAALNAERSPILDEARKLLPKLPTSRVLSFLSHTEQLFDMLKPERPRGPHVLDEEDQQHAMKIYAAALAASDEIDRRIPIPAWLWECTYCGRRYGAAEPEPDRCGGRNLPVGAVCAAVQR